MRCVPLARLTVAFALFAARVDALDIEPTALEVTQTVQRLDNSVRLVANKNTWVRVHARSVGAPQVTNVVTRIAGSRVAPGPVTFLGFFDSKPTTVVASPDRVSGPSFDVQIPLSWRSGTVQIVAVVDFPGDVAEDDEDNNGRFVTVTFEDVPPVRVRAFGVEFPGGSLPADLHYQHIASWLRRGFPTSSLLFEQQTLTTPVFWPDDFCDCPKDAAGACVSTGPCSNFPMRPCDSHLECGCGFLNEILLQRRSLDRANDAVEPDRRYVAIVDDGAGFMRGCSPGEQLKVASGPTGSPVDTEWSWDLDGSYGDFYTAHELGHAYGRSHAPCCGAPDPGEYPHDACDIGTSEHAGWDTSGPVALEATSKDVMSYCDDIWMSDFTFEGIMDRLILEGGEPAPPPKVPGTFAIATGNANLTRDRARITSFFSLPATLGRADASRGDWALRFLDATGGILSTHMFTPHEIADDHDFVPPSIGRDGRVADRVAVFSETVEVPSGPIARLVLYHEDREMDSRAASANPPVVRITAPNGGERIGRKTTVRWSASDADGDPLTFTLLYSADAGATWRAAANEISGGSLAVDLTGLPGSKQALFRILASDGLLTSVDDSDAVFGVANGRPIVFITDPGDGAVIGAGQVAMFEGMAHDAEDGVLAGNRLTWRSDCQGALGSGANLEVDGLKPGTHAITLTAADAEGEKSNAEVTIVQEGESSDACRPAPRPDCDPFGFLGASAGDSSGLETSLIDLREILCLLEDLLGDVVPLGSSPLSSNRADGGAR